MISITSVLADQALLGSSFAGSSWDTWRAVLRAAEGLPLDRVERARFRAVAGDRAPPKRRVSELWAIAGRRSGKDSVASAICTVAAIADYRPYLRPGERASILALAVDRVQARILTRYISGYFENALLRPLVERETADGLELNNGVEIIVATNSFRSIRGRSIAVAVLDEVAFWRDETSANPDSEVYTAILPGTATLPNSLLIGISTHYRRSGLLFEKWERHFGKDDDDILVVAGPSTAFNPSLPRRFIDQAMARDPMAARSEWLGEWRDDIGAWLARDLIMAAVDAGVARRPPDRSCRYFAFADPSGGRNDAFTAAIAHVEGDKVILDVCYERQAPFAPTEVVAEIALLVRQYGLTSVTGDAFGNEWVAEAFREKGIEYVHSVLNRSELYLNCLPLFTSGRARLLDNDRMVRQFLALERRTQPGGHDRVDHAPNGHDDIANAVAGALVEVAIPRFSNRGIFEYYREQAKMINLRKEQEKAGHI
jgi:hypothetical protein